MTNRDEDDKEEERPEELDQQLDLRGIWERLSIQQTFNIDNLSETRTSN